MKIVKWLVVVVLLLTNIMTASLLVRWWWTDRLWEQEMYGMAAYAATMQADAHFRHGSLRLYELAPEQRSEFTGRHDGPYELWRWGFYPSLGRPNRFAAERFVEMYNRRMRYMHDHRDEFTAEPATDRANKNGSSE